MAPSRLRILLAAGVITTGLFEFGQGGYIHAKAALAQVLLENAWARSVEGEDRSKPWSWADTWPVARLRVPGLGVDQIVLDGESGNVLAFAPGRLPGSADSGSEGRIVISGHRDTHFRFLEDISPGARLTLEFPDGNKRRYRVVDTRVADVRAYDGNVPYPATEGLTLITCYPFNALRPGGPLRYLVDADPL